MTNEIREETCRVNKQGGISCSKKEVCDVDWSIDNQKDNHESFVVGWLHWQQKGERYSINKSASIFSDDILSL